MPNIKRTTTKTGTNSKRTTTLSSTGTKTESYSNKPSKTSPRRTVSFNHKTGKTRTTYSQKLGAGWTKISSKTTGGSKSYRPKKSTLKPSKSRSIGGTYSGGSGASLGSLSFASILLMVFCGTIMYLWPVTIPYILYAAGGIVAIWVLFKLIGLLFEGILFLLKWAIYGGILYGLYYLIMLFVQ